MKLDEIIDEIQRFAYLRRDCSESVLDKGDTKDVAWVAKRIPISRRRETLPWSYHQEVAVLEPDVQDKLLEKAEKEKWTLRKLRQEIRKEKQKR
ncbi:MAG: hypothetical protein ACE5PV_09510 [Candidatus Poribacteria bacterium]